MSSVCHEVGLEIGSKIAEFEILISLPWGTILILLATNAQCASRYMRHGNPCNKQSNKLLMVTGILH